MNRFAILILTLAFALGCEDGSLTSPDEDDMAPVVAAVGRLSPGALDSLWLYASNRWAIEWLDKEYGNDDHVGTVWCTTSEKPDEQVEIEEFRMTVRHVVACLIRHPPHSFEECTFDALNRSADLAEDEAVYSDKYGRLTGCRAVLNQDFKPHLLPERLRDPHSWRARELAEALIRMTADELKSRPALMAALGLGVTASGGIFIIQQVSGFSLFLCAQSKAIPCPDDPSEPGEPQYGDQPGGDR